MELSKTNTAGAKRRLSFLAWFLCGLVCLSAFGNLTAITFFYSGQNQDYGLLEAASWALIAVVSALVAALIISNQPSNRIGWLLMTLPISSIIGNPVDASMAQYATTAPPPTVPILLMAWYQNWSWLLLIFPLLLILLLFPTGKPPTSRWKWVQGYAVGLIVLFMLLVSFSETLQGMNGNWSLPNPVGWIPADPLIMELFIPFWIGNLGLLTLICAAALVFRYRRTSPVERLQIKWLLFGGSIFVAFYVPLLLLGGDYEGVASLLVDLALVFSILLFPLTIAVAILRYRLYEIDVIIRKTLIYTILTALLALVFFGSIVILQQIVGSLTDMQDSPFVIVLSTLAIAALFTPLRRLIQDTIDRRFYRKNYNAQKFLQSFSATTRYEVEVEQLAAHLMSVVDETVQPESVNLWLVAAKKP